MLKSNGKLIKQRKNLHMKLEELKVLIDFLKEKYNYKWVVAVMIQFSMGLRCSEMLAINIHDFKDEFRKLDYRQAKTNKVILDEPVPEPCRQIILSYLSKNIHTLKDGYLFGAHNKSGYVSTETYGAFWSKWRMGIAKEHPGFLDQYPTKLGVKYRISSHSLRRLHRTILADKFPDRLFMVSQWCHYESFDKFQTYINEFKLMELRDKLMLPALNPVISNIISMPKEQKRLDSF